VQHVHLRKWGDGLSDGHLPNSLVSLLEANGYNHVPLYVGTWGPFSGSAPVWCAQVMLYKKELSYDIRVVRHTFYAAHQALIAFCQELQDLDSQWLSEMEKYV
jgi:hypothetical protein